MSCSPWSNHGNNTVRPGRTQRWAVQPDTPARCSVTCRASLERVTWPFDYNCYLYDKVKCVFSLCVFAASWNLPHAECYSFHWGNLNISQYRWLNTHYGAKSMWTPDNVIVTPCSLTRSLTLHSVIIDAWARLLCWNLNILKLKLTGPKSASSPVDDVKDMKIKVLVTSIIVFQYHKNKCWSACSISLTVLDVLQNKNILGQATEEVILTLYVHTCLTFTRDGNDQDVQQTRP